MTLTRFFCFRHDVPDNPDNICYGETMDVRFSPDQAYLSQLAHVPDDAIFVSSPLPRTVQTAMKAAQLRTKDSHQSIPLSRRLNLREQSFGAWIGIKRDLLAADPVFALYKADPVNVPPPGGENLKNFRVRIMEEFNDMAAVHQGANVAVFGHAGGIRVIAAEAKQIDMIAALKLPVEPLSVTIISHDSEKKARGENPWALESLNLKP